MEDTKIKEFKKNGVPALLLNVTITILSILGFILAIVLYANENISGGVFGVMLVLMVILFIASCICYVGLKSIKPNEAMVLTLFGKYYGTLKEEGFYFVNPFVESVYPRGGELTLGEVSKNINSSTENTTDFSKYKGKNKISLKDTTLNNAKQKVNDANGNPIEIGVIVIWKVIDPVKAVFNVDDYREFVSIKSDSAIRSVARTYAYDGEDGEKTLTGSTKEISDKLQVVIQESIENSGIEIIDAKISHLAYATEIASAMLQRQQADAIIAARQKIVEGAVGMVEQALQQLSEREVVDLDDERKAQMVSNLLVVLCSNKDTQPIVNSGSIY